MRIESVRIEASGMATIVAAGGFSFSAPLRRFADAGYHLAATRDGYEIGDEEYKALREVAVAWEARQRAIALCARAEQTRAGLQAKLAARGFRGSAVRDALDALEAEGLLSDERFARAWIRAHAPGPGHGPGMGPVRVMAALRSRGVSEETAKAAMADFPVMDALLAELTAALGPADPESAAALSDALRRQLRESGYRGADIDAAFDAYLDMGLRRDCSR